MNIAEITEAIGDAERTQKSADYMVDRVLNLVVGRLRKSKNYDALESIKRELQGFNMRTWEWKEASK